MRLKIDGRLIYVTLSKRNLQTLLNKLEDHGSRRTLIKLEDDGRLFVTAEDDSTHYDNRADGPPGEVHPLHDPNRR